MNTRLIVALATVLALALLIPSGDPTSARSPLPVLHYRTIPRYNNGSSGNTVPDLVGYWPFNGNANDESGNGNHGTVNGAALVADRYGNASSAYSFDGTGDYIEIPANGVLADMLAGTIAFWFQPSSDWDASSPVQGFISNDTGGYNNDFQIGFNAVDNDNRNANTGKVYFHLQGSGRLLALGTATANWSSDNWYFLTFTWNGSQAEVFSNGISEGTLPFSSRVFSSYLPTYVGVTGKTWAQNVKYFSGVMDDVRVYNRALTDEETQTLYTGGGDVTPTPTPEGGCVEPPPGLVAWWPGDGNTDDIQGGYDGILVGNANAGGAGKVGSSFSLDGSGDAVRFGDVLDDVFAGPDKKFTIDFWTKINELPVEVQAVFIGKMGDSAVGPENQRQFTVSLLSDGHLVFHYRASLSEPHAKLVRADTPLSTGVWYHIAVVYDGSVDTSDGLDRVSIYVNGVSQGTSLVGGAAPLGDIQDGQANLAIGAAVASNLDVGYPFNGLIDEVEIFDRTLSASEIQAIYDAGSSGKCKQGEPTSGVEAYLLGTVVGEGAGDSFGGSTANGDLNSDGYNDLVVRTYINDEAGENAGKVYVYTGACLTPYLELFGENAGDEFGNAIDNGGDLNGDGYDDLLVTATKYDLSSVNDAGRAYIYWGGPDMDDVPDLVIPGDPTVLPSGNPPRFGTWAAVLGDISGDGYDDFAISDRCDCGGFDRGRVYIYYGGPSVDDIPDMILPPQGINIFGGRIYGAGDTNGDGYPDVLVFSHDSRWGRAYLYFGGPTMGTSPDVTFDDGAPSASYGVDGLTSADVNNDGYKDIVIGARGIGSGRVFVYYGGTSVDNVADVVLQGENSGDKFGISVYPLGDINGDGYEDIAASAAENDDAGTDAGKVYVFLGGDPMDTTADLVLTGEAPGDKFGSGIRAGDLNGDGVRELIVSAIFNDEGNQDAGKVYVYTFVEARVNTEPAVTADQASVTVDEGDLATNTGTVSDFDGDPVTLDASIGTVTNNGDGTWSWSYATDDGPAESQTVTITADDGHCDLIQTSFDLTVNNVAPMVNVPTIDPEPSDEGSAVTVSAAFSDPSGSNDEPYTCMVDYGDDSGPQAGTVDGNTCTSPEHIYADDGTYTVTVSVTDKDGVPGSNGPLSSEYRLIEEFDSAGGFTSTHPDLLYVDEANSRAVVNVSRREVRLLWREVPELTSGDFRFTVKGQFNHADNNCAVDVRLSNGVPALNDPTPGEVLTRFYFYGGGCPNHFDHMASWWVYPNGQSHYTFQGYQCGGSNGTIIPISLGVPYTAEVEVLSSEETATLSVYDASDSLVGSLTGPAGFQHNFGSLNVLSLGFLGQGDWPTCSAYVDSVHIESIDKENGTGSNSATHVVNNVPPIVDPPAVAPEPSDEGESVSVSATFADPGVNDAPFTCTVNYGDGSGDLPGTVSGNTCIGPTHTYADNGSNEVTVSVTDKDGGAGSSTTTHIVNNVTPAVDAGPDQIAYEDDVVSLASASFTDPGVLDTHTAIIDWGDGTPPEAGTVSEAGGSGSVAGSHTYPDPGVYTVIVTVTDNDGGVGTDTMAVTVVHGFLKFCVFGDAGHHHGEEDDHHGDNSSSHDSEGDHHGVTVYEQSTIDCSVGSNGKVDVKQHTTVAGDVISLEDEVSLDQEANIQGDVTAADDVELKQQSLVQGNVTTGGDAKLKREATVQGDVTAAGEVELERDATVAGAIQEGASVPPVPPITPVVLSLTAGGPDMEVERDGSLTLDPGSYGELKLKQGATLNISSGQYAFSEFEANEGATIHLDLDGSPVVIDVVENLDLKHEVQMEVSGVGTAADILWRVAGSHVHLAQGGSYLGTFLAPSADIDLYQDATLEGALYGQRVDIKERVDVTGWPALDVFVSLFLP